MRVRYLLVSIAMLVAGAFIVPALRAVAQTTVDTVYACTNANGIVTQLRINAPPACSSGQVLAWEVGADSPPPRPGGATYRVVDGAGVDLGAFVGNYGGGSGANEIVIVERPDGVMIPYQAGSGSLAAEIPRGIHYNTPDCTGTPLLEATSPDGVTLIPESYTSYNLVVRLPLEPTAGTGIDVEAVVAEIAADPVPGEPDGSVLLTEDFSCAPLDNTTGAGVMFELVELPEQPNPAIPGLRVVPAG